MTNLMVNSSLSYQALTFNDDYFSGTTRYATKNKVVPNTPKWTIDTDVSYYKEAFFVTMGGKFVANSYMTSTDNQSLPGYTIFTLGFGYDGISKKGPLKNVKIAFNIDHVFDRYYYYSASDTGPTNGSYYAGLPRAYYLTVTGKF
jgi:iron complex outermembrane receptor protein